MRWVGCIIQTELRRARKATKAKGTHHNGAKAKSREAKRQQVGGAQARHHAGDSPNQPTSTEVAKIKNKNKTKPANNSPEGAMQRHSYCYDHTHTHTHKASLTDRASTTNSRPTEHISSFLLHIRRRAADMAGDPALGADPPDTGAGMAGGTAGRTRKRKYSPAHAEQRQRRRGDRRGLGAAERAPDGGGAQAGGSGGSGV